MQFGLELRRLQMLSEIGTENNTTTIIMLPSDVVQAAKNLSAVLPNGHQQEANSLQPKEHFTTEKVAEDDLLNQS